MFRCLVVITLFLTFFSCKKEETLQVPSPQFSAVSVRVDTVLNSITYYCAATEVRVYESRDQFIEKPDSYRKILVTTKDGVTDTVQVRYKNYFVTFFYNLNTGKYYFGDFEFFIKEKGGNSQINLWAHRY